MVLSVILILTALGTVALMGSVSSIKMGARYHNWSKEFYNLDEAAENYVNEVDEKLRQAEQAARTYMEEEKFSVPGYTDSIMDLSTQTFFCDNCWMNQHDAYGQLINTYDAFVVQYMAAHPGASSQDIADAYKAELQAGYRECFEKLYFYYASNLLSTYISGMSAMTNPPVAETFPANIISQLLIPESRTWDTYIPIDILLSIRMLDPVDVKKSVEVEMKVINPVYKTIVKTVFVPIKGNPLWGYALAAGGAVTVSGTPSNQIQVGGDIAAAGGSLSILQNGKLNVFGNVYTNGDVKISGDSGVLHVYDHTSTNPLVPSSYEKKKGIYDQSELGIDQTNANLFAAGLNSLIEPATPSTITVPMFYRDLSLDRWGNVYCKNLIIEDSIQNGNICINGNITTLDDVEMNGLQNNTITIDGNYVGISSEGDYFEGTGTIDPNASSTIFNNQVLNDVTGVDLNNHINLNGGIIVPGTVFREFDAPNQWYQTIESVTGRDRAIFDSYVAEPTDLTAEIYELTSAGVTDVYPMKTLDTIIENRRLDFTTSLSSSSITTNVFGTAGMTGYTLGAVVTQASGTSTASIHMPGTNPVGGIPAYTSNQDNWYSAKNSLKLRPYFDAKTKTFGFEGLAFSALVNEAIVGTDHITAMGEVNMHYLDGAGDHTFDITGKNGIVYCEGDLTLRGTGTGEDAFKGIIIAKGNITLSPAGGAFDIKYDEGVVANILSNEKAWAVRAFFQNGMIGYDDYTFTQGFTATGATKSFLKRYSITKWQEVQAP